MIWGALAVLLTAVAPEAFPPISPGLRPEAIQAFRDVAKGLEAGDWAKAEAAVRRLPSRELRIRFDAAGAPAERRTEYRESAEAAVEAWLPRIQATADWKSAEPAILIQVVGELPDSAPSLIEFKDSGPRVTLKIALQRGEPKMPVNGPTVQTEVLRAIGAYLGLADSPIFGTAMGKSDRNVIRPTAPSGREVFVARKTLQTVAEARELVRTKKRVADAQAGFELDRREYVNKSVRQGDVLDTELRVHNPGAGALQLFAQPDCSCITVTSEMEVLAGQTKTFQIRVDTTRYTGEFRHKAIVWTNAPGALVQEIPISLDIAPRVLFEAAEQGAKLIEDSEVAIDFYLATYGDNAPKPTTVRLEGFEGRTEVSEWPGALNLFKPQPDRAYRIRAFLPPNQRPGRTVGSIVVDTDDPKFGYFRKQIQVQKGIAMVPSQVYFGDVSGAREGFVLIGRPQKPFKILKATSNSANVTVRVEPGVDGWDYRVWVIYDGKAKAPELNALVEIQTDDPLQPVFRIPVQGFIPPSESARR